MCWMEYEMSKSNFTTERWRRHDDGLFCMWHNSFHCSSTWVTFLYYSNVLSAMNSFEYKTSWISFWRKKRSKNSDRISKISIKMISYLCVHEIKIIKTLRHRIEKSELCSQLRFKSFEVFTTTSNNFVLLRLHVVHINSISHQIYHNITDFIHATQYQLSAQLQHSTSSKVVFRIKSIKKKRSQPAGKEAREFARESSFNKIL